MAAVQLIGAECTATKSRLEN